MRVSHQKQSLQQHNASTTCIRHVVEVNVTPATNLPLLWKSKRVAVTMFHLSCFLKRRNQVCNSGGGCFFFRHALLPWRDVGVGRDGPCERHVWLLGRAGKRGLQRTCIKLKIQSCATVNGLTILATQFQYKKQQSQNPNRFSLMSTTSHQQQNDEHDLIASIFSSAGKTS